MAKNNLNFDPSKGQEKLPLLKPGNQGWKNPIPIKYPSQSFSAKSNTMTTEEIQKSFDISPKFLRTCPIGAILPWKAYLIWHRGRDAWKVYEEKLTV